jgi:hypothetical protein
MTDRILPYQQVFGTLGPERFPAIRDAAGGARDVESLLLCRPMVDLLHELRPDEGLGEGVDDFVAFVHACYLHWSDGERVTRLDAAGTRALVGRAAAGAATVEQGTTSRYVQVHPRLLWSRLGSSDIHEPLDGWFAMPEAASLRLVACLGVHPSRPGLSVLAVRGGVPASLRRNDGSPPFAPEMAGGDAASLASVATVEELLALGWHAGG